jgi:hypothetical protein
LLVGHTKLESTVCYLAIEVDDALAILEQVEIRSQKVCGPAPGGAAIDPSTVASSAAEVRRCSPSREFAAELSAEF